MFWHGDYVFWWRTYRWKKYYWIQHQNGTYNTAFYLEVLHSLYRDCFGFWTELYHPSNSHTRTRSLACNTVSLLDQSLHISNGEFEKEAQFLYIILCSLIRASISSMSLQEYAYASILVGKPVWNTIECLGNISIVISCLCCCCTDWVFGSTIFK